MTEHEWNQIRLIMEKISGHAEYLTERANKKRSLARHEAITLDIACGYLNSVNETLKDLENYVEHGS
ncbi:MAG: hypothetical protein IJU61_06075 [Victivallales bacterium]|nr:hypothetical protein [Victivallales bacterium]